MVCFRGSRLQGECRYGLGGWGAGGRLVSGETDREREKEIEREREREREREHKGSHCFEFPSTGRRQGGGGGMEEVLCFK